jgi:hypothetical protein
MEMKDYHEFYKHQWTKLMTVRNIQKYTMRMTYFLLFFVGSVSEYVKEV